MRIELEPEIDEHLAIRASDGRSAAVTDGAAGAAAPEHAVRIAGHARWTAHAGRSATTGHPRWAAVGETGRAPSGRTTTTRQTGRASDAIGRLGLSEFGVIAPGTGPEAALRMVRRLGEAIEGSPLPVRGGERSVRVRAGYCAVPDFAESSMDASELLLRATTALRDLKREGPEGERVRAFDQVTVRYPT